MIFNFLKLIVVTAIFAIAVSMTPVGGGAVAKEATKTVSGRTGDIYIMRGLMDVFSMGMDTLGQKLRGKGFTATVMNHGSWSAVAQKITDRYKSAKYPEPVFLVGHSLGGDAVILLSERLSQNGVPVSLAVTFDPVHPQPVPKNVKRFINYFQSNNGWGAAVKAGPGFKAKLVNEDLKDRVDIGHTTIDKADFLHTKVVSEMVRLSRPTRRKVAVLENTKTKTNSKTETQASSKHSGVDRNTLQR